MNLRMQKRNGFTLIEMLVVIGLTAVLLGLFLGPLDQALKFTHRSQTAIAAQDNARIALAQVSRDLSDAIYVFDNTHSPINFPMAGEDGLPWLDAGNVPPQALYAKIDMVLPKMKCYCTSSSHTAGKSREYDRDLGTGLTEASPRCPEDGSKLEIRPLQPVSADSMVVRYFIGLADPSTPYTNPYAFDKNAPKGSVPAKGMEGTVSNATGQPISTNTYVLYRVEFNPMDKKLFPTTKKDSGGNDVSRTMTDNLDDSNFFYNNNTNPKTYIDANGNTLPEPYWHAWKKICKAVVTVGYTDLVKVQYKADGTPVVSPTVSFAPTSIQNDPMVATTGVADDPERSDPASVGSGSPPACYKATYGHWLTGCYTNQDGNKVLPYEIRLSGTRSVLDTVSSKMVDKDVKYKTKADPLSGETLIKYVDGTGTETTVFNMTKYLSTAISNSYGVGTIDPVASDTIFMDVNSTGVVPAGLNFTVDTTKGNVNFAFPHVNSTTTGELNGISSIQGNTLASFKVSTSDLNSSYTDYVSTKGGEGANRLLAFNYLSNWTPSGLSSRNDVRFLDSSTVVPGMERVVGPDCNPGQSFGKPIQYTRVPFWSATVEPGINQYKMDVKYSDSQASNAAAIYFMSNQPSASGGTDVRLPSSSAGDYSSITAYSPLDWIYVLYYEQNNQIGDSVSADYVTKELITVTMGMRIYDIDGNAQSLQLTDKIKLRNIAL